METDIYRLLKLKLWFDQGEVLGVDMDGIHPFSDRYVIVTKLSRIVAEKKGMDAFDFVGPDNLCLATPEYAESSEGDGEVVPFHVINHHEYCKRYFRCL